jgi:hypothetical protein
MLGRREIWHQKIWLMSPPSRFIQPVPSFIFHSDTRYLAVMGLIDDLRIQLKNHTITKFIHQISLILM